MLPKIFVLIATFCMAEAKLKLLPPLEKLTTKELGDISRKTYQFPVYAFLSRVWDIEGPKESFPKCYEEHGNGYLDVFDAFSTKFLGAMNKLNNRLPTFIGKRRAKNVRRRTEHIANILKKYKEDFKKKVQENNSLGVETLAKKHQKWIDEELTDLYIEMKSFERGAVWGIYEPPFRDCYKEFQDGIDTAVKICKEIEKKIKDCIEKKNEESTDALD